jgi:hypothetical protein
MITAPIDDAIDAVFSLQLKEPDQNLVIHHNSMLTTLEFLQECGFNHVSLEDSEELNKR